MNIEYIVNKYTNLVYKICLDMLSSSLDAQDMTQEVFIGFYLHINDYINLPENDIKNIICKIALNKCRDYLKSKSYKLKLLTNDDDTELANYEEDIKNPDYNKDNPKDTTENGDFTYIYEYVGLGEDNDILEEIIKNDSKNYINKIINELKEPYKSIIYNYYIVGLSLDELCAKLNTSKPTLKVQLYRAKQILKEKLNNGGGFV